MSDSSLTQVAVYHPWPRLNTQPIDGWVKNMLLFFDTAAVIAPPSAIDELGQDGELIAYLVENGLFRFLDPKTLLDDTAANHILAFLSTPPQSQEPTAR